MTNPKAGNIAASVKARLLNLSKIKQRPYLEILQYYGMERFLYRLGKSDCQDQFVLKGALLFHVWDLHDARATKDIDMLAKTNNSLENIIWIVRKICSQKVACPDGIIFDEESVKAEKMQSQREYEGIRIKFQGRLETTRIPMQIDLGFGDIVTPASINIDYPTLLQLPAPDLRGYPVETLIAEKIHAMIEKGMFNSRMKDYHDVWLLLTGGYHREAVLEQALKRTFGQRNTKLNLAQLIDDIERYGRAKDRQLLWQKHRQDGQYEMVPQELHHVCQDILQGLKYLFVNNN